MADKYFLSEGNQPEKEVSIEEYCAAERRAGFRPKVVPQGQSIMTTPATGGFSAGNIRGRTECHS